VESATPSPEGKASRTILECLLQGRTDADDRAIPESSRGSLPPPRALWIENRVIPEDTVVGAASGLRLFRVFTSNSKKLFCDEMLRVPELAGALVRDSGQSATNGRTQVGGKHGLPHHEQTERRVRIALQELFDCGGPPQTS